MFMALKSIAQRSGGIWVVLPSMLQSPLRLELRKESCSICRQAAVLAVATIDRTA